MLRFLRSLKYNYFVSRLARVLAFPVIKVGDVAEVLKPRLKINSGTVRYYGARLIFPKNIGVNTSSKIFWKGEFGYEHLIGLSMTSLLVKAKVLLDIGSNFGFYSVLAQKLNPELFSFCFEPVTHLVNDNKKFHEVNKVKNFKLYNKAVGDQVGVATIKVPEKAYNKFLTTSASLSNEFVAHKAFKTIDYQVDVVTIDSFSKEMANEFDARFHRTVIKIDVEGFELPVLTGGTDFFTKYNPVLFLELFLTTENITKVFQVMSQIQYQIFAFAPQGLIRLTKEDLLVYSGDRNFLLIPSRFFSGSNLVTYNQLETYFDL